MEFQWSSARSGQLGGIEPSLWRTAVPRYSKVRARNLYPGIDAIYYFKGQSLEFDLVVQPGSELRHVRLVTAATADPVSWEVQSQGGLVSRWTKGSFHLRQPRAFQVVDGVRREVSRPIALTPAAPSALRWVSTTGGTSSSSIPS